MASLRVARHESPRARRWAARQPGAVIFAISGAFRLLSCVNPAPTRVTDTATPLRVLLVEDNEDDAALVEEPLKQRL